MKYLNLFFLVALFIGCGKPPSTAQISTVEVSVGKCNVSGAGKWFERDGTALTLNDDCTGTDSACKSTFTWEPSVNDVSAIEVTATDPGKVCPEVGAHRCNIWYATDSDGEHLWIKCPPSGIWRQYGRNQ